MMLKVKEYRITNAINQVSVNRFEKVEEIKVGNDFNYQDALIRQKRMYEKLISVINPQDRKLLREFEEISSYMAYVEARIMYRQGITDGMALSRLMGGAENE